MQPLTSLIVGPGAIGALTCAHIQNYSAVFVYPHRSNMFLATQLLDGDNETHLNWQLQHKQTKDLRLIWVCCKSFIATETTHKLLTLHPNSIAILMHNGMGPQETLSAQFTDRIIVASTTCGALKISQTQFKKSSFGLTSLGIPSADQALELRQVFYTISQWLGPLKFSTEIDINTVLWKKVAINSVINPLTAWFKIKNGDLLAAKYQPIIFKLCTEIETILKAYEIILDHPLPSIVKQIAELSADNQSSMARDVELGQKTEIDQIVGYLIDRAIEKGLDTSNLQLWYHRINDPEN